MCGVMLIVLISNIIAICGVMLISNIITVYVV